MNEFVILTDFYFHWGDYVVFTLCVLISTFVGIVVPLIRKQGVHENKLKEVDYGSEKMNEFLVASRQLGILPVALSLVGSYVSGITMLGTSTEIYSYGTQYCMIVFAIIAMAFPVALIYVPVFVTVGVRSSYEYLEMRFSKLIRSASSVLFVIDELVFLPVILHVPSIAFSQVTGIPSILVSTVMCIACAAYTILGGIKVVVHTDAWQVFIMYISMIIVVISGLAFAGGFAPVIEAASEGGRLIFANLNPSMYDRQTLWAVLIGGFSYWTGFNSVNQTMVQRYMSLPSLFKIKASIVLFTTIIAFFVCLCCFSGLLIYYTYRNCDPLTAGFIKISDQLFPLYVVQTVGKIPGIPGLFIAGLFGAALSSLSVVLHSTALVILEDIIKSALHRELSQRHSVIVINCSVIALSAFALTTVILYQGLGGILGVVTSLTAVSESANFGLFTLGMLVPWCNSAGAITGVIVSFIFSSIISVGTQITGYMGKTASLPLPVSVSECPSNVTLPPPKTIDTDIFPLFRLSFHWVHPIGVLTTVLVGSIVSRFVGSKKEFDIELLAPIVHRFVKKSEQTTD